MCQWELPGSWEAVARVVGHLGSSSHAASRVCFSACMGTSFHRHACAMSGICNFPCVESIHARGTASTAVPHDREAYLR